MDCVHLAPRIGASSQMAWRFFSRGLARSLLAAFLLATAFGNADAAGTKIEILSLARIPMGTTVEIRLPVGDGPDDLGLTAKLARYFSDTLTELGYSLVAGDGELIFRFAAEEPTYALGDSQYQFSRKPSHETWADAYRADILRVSYADQTILGQSNRDLYRLRVSVARERKPPLWAGYIERSVKGANRLETYSSMAKALMAHWGRSYSGVK